MDNETIKWQKQEANKLFQFIQSSLDFDNLNVVLPNNHPLTKISNVTIKKFMSYLLAKLNNQQGLEFEKGFKVQGYIDDDDITVLLNTFYKIIDITDRQIKKDFNLCFRYLSSVILQYEEELKTITQLQTQLNQLKKDFKNNEEIIYKVKKMEDEISNKIKKTEQRLKEAIEDIEKIWNIKREEETKEKPIVYNIKK